KRDRLSPSWPPALANRVSAIHVGISSRLLEGRRMLRPLGGKLGRLSTAVGSGGVQTRWEMRGAEVCSAEQGAGGGGVLSLSRPLAAPRLLRSVAREPR